MFSFLAGGHFWLNSSKFSQILNRFFDQYLNINIYQSEQLPHPFLFVFERLCSWVELECSLLRNRPFQEGFLLCFFAIFWPDGKLSPLPVSVTLVLNSVYVWCVRNHSAETWQSPHAWPHAEVLLPAEKMDFSFSSLST